MADIVATVGASGYDYTSLVTAEASEQGTYGNLVGDGNTMTFEIYGTVDEGAVALIVNDWTTGASNRVTITSGSGEHHNGVPGGGAVFTSSASSYTLRIQNTYVVCSKLEIKNTNASAGYVIGVANDFAEFYECIISATGGNALQIVTSGYDNNIYQNCLFKTDSTSSSTVYTRAINTFQNCTFVGGGYSFSRADSDAVTLTNCLAIGGTTGGYNLAGSDSGAAVTMTYCASEDTSATGTGAVTGITSADYNTTYRPLDTGNLWGAGTDLSGTFTSDIRGQQVRDVWSIGAYDSDYVIYTLRSSAGDYSSMSTWESTEQADLTSTGDKHILECYADWASGLVENNITLGGWTTSATNFITIRAAAGQGHKGVVDEGFYLASTSVSTSRYLLQLAQAHTIVSDIGFSIAGSHTGYDRCLRLQGNPTYLRNLWLYANNANASGTARCIQNDTATDGEIYNCLMLVDAAGSTGSSALYHDDFRAHAVYNCTAINLNVADYGYNASATGNEPIYKNCVASGFDVADFDANVDPTSDYNASGDTSAPGTTVYTGIASGTDFFATGYRPIETGDLWGTGTDLSATAGFTDDLRGETRTEWSIGAVDTDYILRTLRDGTGDYSLMSTWESTEQADLTASGDKHILECYNDWASGLDDSVSLNGWTTSSSYYVTVRTASGHAHKGMSKTGFFMSRVGSVGSSIFSVWQDYSVINDIEVENLASSQARGFYNGTTTTHTIVLNRCIASCPNDTDINYGAFSTRRCTMTNCLAFDSHVAFNMTTVFYGSRWYNCTAVNSSYGFRSNGTGTNSLESAYARNCVAYNNSTADFTGTAFNTVSSNNASGDTSVSTLSIGTVTGITTADFVDTANDNYRPVDTQDLWAAGADLSGTFTDDIRGETRSVWSIGAFDTDYILRTLKSTGGDYSSIVTWEQTEQKDLTSTGDKHILDCYKGTTITGNWAADGSLNEEVHLIGWTTNSSYFVTIRAAAGQGHNGVPGTGFMLASDLDTLNAVLIVNQLYSKIQNIEAANTLAGYTGTGVFRIGFYSTIENCIGSMPNSTAGTVRVFLSDFNSEADYNVFINCLAYNTPNNLKTGFYAGGDPTKFINCTSAMTAGTDFSGSAVAIVKNCAGLGGGTNFAATSYGTGTDYNASVDISAPGTTVYTGIASGTDYNTTYRPLEAGDLWGAGEDLSTDFTSDIRSRPRDVWSIGAYDSDYVIYTLKSTGGDYSSISVWESTEQTDLTTSGDKHILECYADWPSGLNEHVEIQDWVTTATNTITVKAAAGHEHKGVLGAGFKLVYGATPSTLTVNQPYCRFYDIEIEMTSAVPFPAVLTNNVHDDQEFHRCIIGNTGSDGSALRLNACGPHNVYNCLIYNANPAYLALEIDGRDNAGNIYNNTVIGTFDVTTTTKPTANFQNNVFYGAADTDADGGGTNTNNAFGSTGAFGSNQVTIDSSDFVDFANDNYRPDDAQDLWGAGADLSGTFTDDLRGETRSVWSIGAFDTDYILRTLGSTGKDYSSMITWEQTEQTSLTASGDKHILECYKGTTIEGNWQSDGTLNEALYLNGWTTSPTYYITIRAAAGEGHGGVPGAGFHMKRLTAGSVNVFEVSQDSTVIQDIEASCVEAAFTSLEIFRINQGCLVERCIASAPNATGGTHTGFWASLDSPTDSTPSRFYNCLAIMTNVGTVTGFAATQDVTHFYNCTAIGADRGFDGYTGAIAKNCVAFDNNADFFNTFDTTNSSNNASGDTSVSTLSIGTITGIASGTDLHATGYRPINTGDLWGAGADLSATIGSLDLRGETRTQWSIGAFDTDYILRTLKSTGGDYSSIATWEESEQTDLATAGDKHILDCYADWPSGLDDSVNIDGWTVDASFYITVKAAAGHEHNGVPGDGFYISTDIGSNFGQVFRVSAAYTEIYGIEVRNTRTGFQGQEISLIQNYNVVDRVIVISNSTSADTGINVTDDNNVVRNSLVIHESGSISGSCIAAGNFDPNIQFYNCTTIGGRYGINVSDSGGSPTTVRNCVAYGAYTSDYLYTNVIASNNASGDTSALGTSPITGITADDFVDFANGDYRINADSALYNAGVDLSSTFTDDIRGTATRYASSFDIGAYKFDINTVTVGSGKDYTLFSTAESSEQGNLVALGEQCSFEIFGTISESGTLSLTDWDTDALCFIEIKAGAGEEHGGVVGGGAEITTSYSISVAFQIYEPYTELRDIQFTNSSTGAGAQGLRLYPTNFVLERCIIRTAGGERGLRVAVPNAPSYIRNSLIISASGTACVIDPRGEMPFSNNTLICGTGTSNSLSWGVGATTTDIICRNNVFYGPVDDTSVTTPNASSGYNAFSSTGAFGSNQQTIDSTDFNNFAGGDYSPSSGSALIDNGIDLSATLGFDDDIAGNTRTGTWDIGAYEYTVTGITITPDGNSLIITGVLPSVSSGATGWTITDVDIDETIYEGQTGVIITISGTVAASGKRVFLEQGGTRVEQLVTDEDATTITITVNFGGLAPGAATLYVWNPI